ncbi:MAG: ArsR/SmtB family transcription factor [Salinigranum sp.]
MPSLRSVLSRRASAVSLSQDDPDVISIDDHDADAVFSVLSSNTARSILAALYESPQTASEVAERVDTSLQNVNYHLENLRDAELIEVVDTVYSNQGREMKVYAPTKKAVVVFASDDLDRSSLLESLLRLVGAVGFFALVSFVVGRLLRKATAPTSGGAGGTGGAGGAGGAGGVGGAGGAGGAGGQPIHPAFPVSPGLVFFAGCVLALVVFVAWRRYRSS